MPRVERWLYERYPDVNAVLNPLDNGPPVTAPVEVRVSSPDPKALFAIADDVKQRLAEMGGTKNITDNWGRWVKKLMVNVDQPRARRAGVSNLDIALSLQTILSGISVTDFRENEDIIPVVMRTAEAERQDIGKLETLDVFAQSTGRTVPLKQVADVDVVWEPSVVKRRDRLRTIMVSAYLEKGVTAMEVVSAIDDYLVEASRAWPLGTVYSFGGEVESSEEANQAIAAKMPIAFMIILLLLVSQFNSFKGPLIIVLTIPLALIGVFVGLVVMRGAMGFMAFLGLISLAGIVINNAIVLLDRIQIEIKENGLAPQRAVIESAQKRLRPILLTTGTTIGGLIPLYLGGGPMWESMCIAIMFGLAFATVLTLGVVPILYSLFYRVSFRDYEA
jgi:multidrug efflux pump subunit AcrB